MWRETVIPKILMKHSSPYRVLNFYDCAKKDKKSKSKNNYNDKKHRKLKYEKVWKKLFVSTLICKWLFNILTKLIELVKLLMKLVRRKLCQKII